MQSPFLLTNPTAIGFSGGRTSGKMLWEILQAHGGTLPPNAYVTFENTGKEREETLRFIQRVAQEWKVNVIWLEYCYEFDIEDYRRPGGKMSKRPRKITRPFFKIVDFETASRQGEPYRKMIDYYYQYRTLVKQEPPVLPNPVQRLCTAHLKVRVSNHFMRSQGWDKWDFFVGIRADEPKRYTKMMNANGKKSQPFWSCCPLYESGVVKADVNAFWKAQPFDLELDPESNEGNCDLCFLKSFPKIVAIMRKTEAYDAFWIEMEEKTGQVFRRDRPTYREIREMIRRNDPIIQQLVEAAGDDKGIDCICGEGD